MAFREQVRALEKFLSNISIPCMHRYEFLLTKSLRPGSQHGHAWRKVEMRMSMRRCWREDRNGCGGGGFIRLHARTSYIFQSVFQNRGPKYMCFLFQNEKSSSTSPSYNRILEQGTFFLQCRETRDDNCVLDRTTIHFEDLRGRPLRRSKRTRGVIYAMGP